ncbi:hypothetical protein [Halobacillus sp. Marseille-P3879]|uniref:hypothetical protein n=1 Tax=Halobacillus sp. Marseille-P3879 TaxID=2045014 RepID=UPI000C7DE8C1|nr:hypothetical protein [Halobacillus sp. Marseille-P3879]
MKHTFLLLGMITLFFTACSDTETTSSEGNIPAQLVFEGENSNWEVVFEVQQSPNEESHGKYNYLEKPVIKYIGENKEEKEKNDDDYPISWEIQGEQIVESQASLSHFQSRLGILSSSEALHETDGSEAYLKEDASLELTIEWGEKKETIPLELTSKKL